jgi:hypothetical protein
MPHRANSPGGSMLAATRRIVVRLAEVACPPELRADDLTENLLAEFEALLSALPSTVRRPVLAGLVAFDRGARLHPRARGRRFVRLDDAAAEAYFRAVLARGGLIGTALARVKGLIVMCYYELPSVKERIGYRPDTYIAAVSRRRLATYGAEIRAGEAAVFARGDALPPGGSVPRGHPGPRWPRALDGPEPPEAFARQADQP